MTTNKEALRKAVSAYKSKYEASRFLEPDHLKPRQLESAIRNICPNVKPSEVVAFLDDTLFNSGKKGFLLTEDTLYFSSGYYIKGNKSRRSVNFSDLETVKKMVKYRSCVGIVHTGGETDWLYAGAFQDDLFDFFAKFMRFRSQEQSTSQPEPPTPKAEPVKAEPPKQAPAEKREPAVKIDMWDLVDLMPEENVPKCPICCGRMTKGPGKWLGQCTCCETLVREDKALLCERCGGKLKYVSSDNFACETCGRKVIIPCKDQARTIRTVPKTESVRTTPVEPQPAKPTQKPEPKATDPLENRQAQIIKDIERLKQSWGIREEPAQSDLQTPLGPAEQVYNQAMGLDESNAGQWKMKSMLLSHVAKEGYIPAMVEFGKMMLRAPKEFAPENAVEMGLLVLKNAAMEGNIDATHALQDHFAEQVSAVTVDRSHDPYGEQAYALGCAAMEAGQLVQYWTYIEEAAVKFHPEAVFAMVRVYMWEESPRHNPEMAVQTALLAARLGHRIANLIVSQNEWS